VTRSVPTKRKQLRKFRKYNKTLIKYYTATDTKDFTGIWSEKEQSCAPLFIRK